jgi:2OG-Fe(II) oxygenase superfamily
MVDINAERQSALSADYARKGFALIPELIKPAVAAAWELKHRLLPGRKVMVGSEYQAMWIEQRFPDPSLALDGLASMAGFIDLITTIAKLNAIDRSRTEVWINRYSPGDHVPKHCDRAGSTQLVICLQGLLEPERGGDLIIRDDLVPLRAGDAVLFFARGVSHGILPIESPKVGSSGFSRVTCVIRLYAPNDL